MISNLQHYWPFWFEVSAMHLGSYNPLWTLLPRSCFDVSPTQTGYALSLKLGIGNSTVHCFYKSWERVRLRIDFFAMKSKSKRSKTSALVWNQMSKYVLFEIAHPSVFVSLVTLKNRLDALKVRYLKRVESLNLINLINLFPFVIN